MIAGRELLAALATAVAAASLARLAVRPTPRLAPRVRPYTVAARSSLGRSADVGALTATGEGLTHAIGSLVERLAAGLGRLVDHIGDDVLLLRLRQAGLLQGVPEARRAQEYRIRQLGATVAAATALASAALLAGQPAGRVLLAAAGGCVFGATRWRGRVDRAITDRRLRMQIELYTINQLLAMNVRVGGGVAQALQRVVERGRGEIVGELAEVLAAHRSGRRMGEALEHAARSTAEPHAARTYKLLAGGAEYGADLAEGLRVLSEDIRNQRAETVKRAATRRRAAMLVPIIAILAPVMLLFVAAPLPSIVFGGR